MEIQSKPKRQHTATRAAAARPSRRLCYRPAALCHHLHLTALTHKEKLSSRSKILFQIFLLFKIA
jgi:hypothetical protein